MTGCGADGNCKQRAAYLEKEIQENVFRTRNFSVSRWRNLGLRNSFASKHASRDVDIKSVRASCDYWRVHFGNRYGNDVRAPYAETEIENTAVAVAA
jgi:hypothetical protein